MTRNPQHERVRGESPLGPWEYMSWRPPELAGAVDHLWAFTGPSGNLRKRVFPNGCIELIVNLAEPYRVLEGAGIETLRHAFVGGILAGPLLIEQPRCAHFVRRGAGAPSTGRSLRGSAPSEVLVINTGLKVVPSV